jgi:hypothetical protein
MRPERYREVSNVRSNPTRGKPVGVYRAEVQDGELANSLHFIKLPQAEGGEKRKAGNPPVPNCRDRRSNLTGYQRRKEVIGLLSPALG